VRKGDSSSAIGLLFIAPAFAVAFSWSWTGSLFAPFEWAKRHVEGVEGDHRHEWYAFKGQRVRVFLDTNRQPWFALNEIAFILALKGGKKTFRHYGPREFGVPESASEHYLSESGLRRLIKYSVHPEAGALGIWLERDVLRVLRRRMEIRAADESMQEK
jgi:prophage antirepressor-like protein